MLIRIEFSSDIEFMVDVFSPVKFFHLRHREPAAAMKRGVSARHFLRHIPSLWLSVRQTRKKYPTRSQQNVDHWKFIFVYTKLI